MSETIRNQDKGQQQPQKETDVTRSQRRQATDRSEVSHRGEEKRAEGSVNKGNPEHQHGSHEEGQAPHQSDDPTMHPSDIDEDK